MITPTGKACTALVFAGAVLSTTYGAPTYRLIALTGEPAPGTTGDYTFLAAPALNDLGQATFIGVVAGGDITESNNRGIWSEGTGELALAMQEGDAAPGTGEGVFFGNSFLDPKIDNEGNIAFQAQLVGPGVSNSSNRGIWAGMGGTGFRIIAREGDPAPGTVPTAVFREPNDPVYNSSSHAAFVSAISGSSALNVGVWSETPGAGLGFVARRGSQAPGADAGQYFDGFGGTPTLNNNGAVAFFGALDGPGVVIDNNHGIWSNAGGAGLELVVRRGNLAPHTEPGVVWSDLRDPVMTDSGLLAFRGALENENGSSAGTGIWAGNLKTGLRLVTPRGIEPPGVEKGSFLGGNSQSFNPSINNAGHVVFKSNLNGLTTTSLNDAGVWSEGSGTGLQLVVQKGDNPPGFAAGIRFNRFFDPTINNEGRSVFFADLTGTGINSSNFRSIWSSDASGELVFLVRTGDEIDVDSDPLVDDLRTIDFISFDPHRAFNDFGQIAIALSFTDGSDALFVITIDEPESGCAADFNNDGDVDLGDFGFFGAAFNSITGDINFEPPADFNNDGDVDLGDFGVFGSEFGRIDCFQ